MAPRSSRFAIRRVVLGAFFVSLVVGALGCTADPASWMISFSGGTAPAGTVSVHAEIRTGSCEGAAIFSDDVAMGERTGMTPSELADGTYYFYAEARSANCGALATGCTIVTVPVTTESIIVTLLGGTAGPRCDTSTCNAGVCGRPDAGQMDLGVDLGVDLGPPDLGEPPDFGVSLCMGEGTACGTGATAGLCRSGNCCPGCWDGTVCRAGTENIQCGDEGAMCVSCAPAGTCVSATGMCMTTPTTVDPQPLALAPLNSFIILPSGRFASAGDNMRVQRGEPRTASPMDWSFESYTGTAMFVTVAATQFTGYGLTSVGELFAWGTNLLGLLGVGSGTATPQAMPMRSGMELWRTIDAGTQHVCGIRQSGQLACWGDRTDGRIGVGATTGSQTSPLNVDGATDWAMVSAGDKHTCAIKTSGQLFCWGYNGGAMDQSGQLGLGDFDPRDTPQRVGSASDWRTVSAGNAHTCAIKTSGELYCWGEASSWGRLGLGATDPGAAADVRSPERLTSPALTWDSVVAGQFHSCAIGSDREIYCWGLAFRGATGTGTGDTVYVPTRVATESGPWSHVATGWSHTCGRQMDGDYFCWGEAAGSRTGTGVDPRPVGTYIFDPTPADIF